MASISAAEGNEASCLRCAGCTFYLEYPKHRMLCGHKFCEQCFEEMKQRYQNENIEQYCPVDGTKIDVNNKYPEQISLQSNELNSRSELLCHISSKISSRGEEMNSMISHFRDMQNDLICSKGNDEQLIEMIQNRIEHTKKTRKVIETTVAGLQSIRTEADEDIWRCNRSSKIEKKEAASLGKQWQELHDKAEESRKKYQEKYRMTLDNLNKARDLISRLTESDSNHENVTADVSELRSSITSNESISKDCVTI